MDLRHNSVPQQFIRLAPHYKVLNLHLLLTWGKPTEPIAARSETDLSRFDIVSMVIELAAYAEPSFVYFLHQNWLRTQLRKQVDYQFCQKRFSYSKFRVTINIYRYACSLAGDLLKLAHRDLTSCKTLISQMFFKKNEILYPLPVPRQLIMYDVFIG